MCGNLFVVFLIGLLSTEILEAAYVTKCKSSDANCIKSSALAAMPAFAAGIPELNVAPLDPLHIESLDASSDGIKMFLKDLDVTGLKDCDMQRMERDVANSKLIAVMICDMVAKGQYEIDGNLAILPIKGKGDAYVELNQVLFEFVANMGEKIDKQGVKHWTIKSFTPKFELQNKSKLRLDNLFDGNKQLAGAISELFENNANEVIKAIGDPIVKGIVGAAVKQVNHFFHRVPYEDLSID